MGRKNCHENVILYEVRLAPGGIVRIQRSGREPGTCPHPRCWPRLRPGSFQWALAGAGTCLPVYGELLFGQSRVRRNDAKPERSEEHTSELQSQSKLVFRLLLEYNRKFVWNFA